ncbi:MAG: tetratricopeptide repeat protein [Bacteroidota bacterium]
MNRLLVYHLLIILLPVIGFSQADPSTALENSLPKNKGKERVLVLTQLTHQFAKSNPSEAIKRGEEALLICNQLNFYKEKIDVLINLGHVRRETDDNDLAMEYFEEAEAIAAELEDNLGIANAMQGISLIYSQRAEFEKAVAELELAKSVYQELDHLSGETKSLINLSKIYIDQKKYDRAVDYLLEARAKNDTLKDDELSYSILEDIGHIYQVKGDLDEALAYYQEAKILIEEQQNLPAKGYLYQKIGLVYLDKGINPENPKQGVNKKNLDTAYDYLMTALDVFKSFDDEDGKAACYAKLGIIQFYSDTPELASSWLKRAIPIYEKLGYKKELSSVKADLAMVLLDQGKVEEAAVTYWQVLELADSLKDLSTRHKATQGLAQSYAASGDYKNAFNLLNDAAKLRESLNLEEINKAKVEAEARFESELQRNRTDYLIEKDNVNNIIISQQRFQNIVLSASIFLILAIVIYILYNRRQIKKAYLVLSRQSEKIRRQKEELAMKNQMLEDLNREKDGLIGVVAHDLKSPLAMVQNISEMIADAGSLNDDQNQYLGMLNKMVERGNNLIRDLLDINFYESAESAPKLEKIVVDDFMDELLPPYKQKAIDKDIHLVYAGNENLQFATDTAFLSRILDNLISNAIKFSPFGKNIFLTVSTIGEVIQISVKDQGPGISPDDQQLMFKKFQKLSAVPTAGENSTGLGLFIVKTLVEKMNGEVSVQSREGQGAEFVVLLPNTSHQHVRLTASPLRA